ncbi:MAG: DNA polymerase I [Chitinispirillaceae bacterium]
MSQPEKHLYLVDAHALIYRSYFAMIRNPLSTSKGQPTSAVLGFANYLLRLLSYYDCPYLAVVFDSGKASFRQELYTQYKANRSAMPDDLKSQIPLVHQLVKHLNVPSIKKDGYEADDIIAHLTRDAVDQGFSVSLVTKDKDLMQLVGDRVRMLSPEGTGTLSEWGAAEVEEKMGVSPQSIRDLLALMGDSSDNIPGIPGVGPKTAVKIIQEVGTLDALLKDPSILPNPRLRSKITENLDMLDISKQLVTLNTDIQLDISVTDLAMGHPHRTDCIAFFKELEFHSLLKHPLFEVREKAEFEARTVGSMEQLQEIVDSIVKQGECCLDVETTSLSAREAKLVGIALALNEQESWYIPIGHKGGHNLDLPRVIETLRSMLESEAVDKIGQNLKYDYQVFRNYGIVCKGLTFDTMIAAYLLDPGKRRHGLDGLAEQWLDIRTTEIETLIGKGKNQICFSQVSTDEAARYAGEDVILPLKLRDILQRLLRDRELLDLFNRIEMPLVTVLAEMEWKGIFIDTGLLSRLSHTYSEQLDEISADIYAMAGKEFNLNSPKQIAEVFYEDLGMPKSRKTKTGLSTNVTALEKLAHDYPIARKLLDYREVQKLLSTYIDALPAQVSRNSGRVHSSFNQTIAATGRLSSTNPNLQNIPIRTEAGRKIREAFAAPENLMIVAADYSQIELRILAHLSNDPRLIEAFENDLDIHTQTAAAIYMVMPEFVQPRMRRAAKTINFGLMYGMGPANLSKQLGISFKEARAFIETYFHQFPLIQAYMNESIGKARLNGYTETLLGRRRYLPDINAKSRQVREAAERTAINTPVQGTAADIIKLAMLRVHEQMPQEWPGATMLLQVHDELVFEVPAEQTQDFRKWVQTVMEKAYELSVRLKVDVGAGRTWGQAH